ncbi:hypothetical protein ACG74X_08800 [Marivita sp. S0852]|uniref:hypothetical protein n=1 Tax=Marivita sp. S0852 TaxID=3373893 RepID=UPI00398232CC
MRRGIAIANGLTRLPVSAGAAAYVTARLNTIWIAQIVGLADAVSGIVSPTRPSRMHRADVILNTWRNRRFS